MGPPIKKIFKLHIKKYNQLFSWNIEASIEVFVFNVGKFQSKSLILF